LLVDLDSLTSFLRGLLPAVRLQFCDLNMVGISKHPSPQISSLATELELDDCLLGVAKPEDLIVSLPHLAAHYLCDTNTLRAFDSQPLAA
jgi:hypothetical protein